MKTYKIMRIMEQDFGCEERPDNETGETSTVSIADEELYRKNIDAGCLVTYDDQNIFPVIKQ